MKFKNKLIAPIVGGFLVISILPVHAVSPGGGFSTSISCGNIQGSVSVSGSNATVTSAGNWCEQGQSISVSAVAGGAGTATVTVYTVDASNVADPNNVYLLNSGTYVGASSVSVVAPSSSGGGGGGSTSSNKTQFPDPKDDTSSKDNDLKSLSVSEGKLSPDFSKDVTEYTVNLPSTAKSITIGAEANDAKASVTGAGEKALEAGDNVFEIAVVAENLSAKAYKVNVVVDEKPSIYINFNGSKLGVVKNTRNAVIPPNFKETTIKVKGKEIPAWTNDAMKVTIVYLMDSKNNKQFYLYEDGKVTTSFTYTKILDKEAFLVEIPEKIQDKTGMKYQKLKIGDVELMGWTFEDKEMKNYEIFYVMDLDGQYRYYQHEKSQNTIQLYSGAAAVTQSEYAKQVNTLKDGRLAMMIWAIGATLLFIGSGGFLLFKTLKKKG